MTLVAPDVAWERLQAVGGGPDEPQGDWIGVHDIALFLLDLNMRLKAVEAGIAPTHTTSMPHVHVTAHRSGFPPAEPVDLASAIQRVVETGNPDFDAVSWLGFEP